MPSGNGLRRSTVKSAARKLGLSVDEYLAKLAAGLKWCTKGRHWDARDSFPPSLSYSDGRSPICMACRVKPIPPTDGT